jgi:3-hydroxybutyryl-CoA dehydrogenase
MRKIIVIGTGTMAAGIAAGFIAEQYSVVILGRTLEKADACLAKGRVLSQITSSAKDHHQTGLIETWNAWDDCVWVIETVTENLAIKQAIFKSLDQRVPSHIPIGSNSSGFPISKIAQGLPTAARMMGAHYFMPADIVPLVEIVMGEKTDPTLAEQVCTLYKSIYKI